MKNVKSALCPSNRDQYMNHYLNTYCSLLKVSQSLCKQAKADPDFRNHAIVSVVHMAYGWMPATLTMCDINQEIKNKNNWMHSMLKRREMQENSQNVLHLHLLTILALASVSHCISSILRTSRFGTVMLQKYLECRVTITR